MNAPIVAADTNLLLHPTPRRYLTVLEGLCSRPVAVLPSIDREVQELLPAQAMAHIRKTAEREGRTDEERVESEQEEAQGNATRWWEEERTSNLSCYTFTPDLGREHYMRWMRKAPEHAFRNHSDWRIYAEAMAHSVNVLASQNRETTDVDAIEHYFRARGKGSVPVTVRTLWQHTIAVAESEGRAGRDVALETVLCAVVPEQWQETPVDVVRAMWSATRFKDNLSMQGSRSMAKKETGQEPASDDLLAHALHRALETTSSESALEKLRAAYVKRPHAARQSEAKYHLAARQKRRMRHERAKTAPTVRDVGDGR